MKLYIYTQTCMRGGREVSERLIEEYDGNPDDGGDWDVFEGTEEGLIEVAGMTASNARKAKAGTDLYMLRSARTILEAVGWGEEHIDQFMDNRTRKD